MALTRCEGIVLKTHALGDTSLIVAVFTRELGLVRLVAKGARRSPRRFGYALEPLSRSRLVLYHKPDRDLHLVSQADTLDPIGGRLTDLARLAHAQAAAELVDRLVWGEEPHPELFDLLAGVLAATAALPDAALPALTLAFELQVADHLGYRPRLDACASCSAAPSARRRFSPARGGLLCDRCAGSEPEAVRLSADALAGMALLLSLPPGEAGGAIPAGVAGELRGVVDAFLRHHFQRFQGLRSLELLRALPAAPRRSPCPA